MIIFMVPFSLSFFFGGGGGAFICIYIGWDVIRSLSPPLFVSGPYPLAGIPPVLWRGMERGGGESPRLRESPERRGSSSPDIGGPPPKMGRLELNGSPTGHRSRHNGAPQRPFSGKTLTSFTVPTFILYMHLFHWLYSGERPHTRTACA